LRLRTGPGAPPFHKSAPSIRATRRRWRERFQGRSCGFSRQAVNKNIFPEQQIALFDREAARAARVEVETKLPRHADAAVDLNAVARCGVISLGRRNPRGRGGGDEITVTLARGRVNAVGAGEFDEP